jgi:hypothetical protein
MAATAPAVRRARLPLTTVVLGLVKSQTIKPTWGLGCRRFRFIHSRGHVMMRTRTCGHVMFRRWVKNQAIERKRGFRPLMGLSLNRRNKYTKDKAQDCKTLHRSSPFLTSVHSADLFNSLSAADLERTETSVRRRFFSGVNEHHLNFRTNGKERFRKIRRVVQIRPPCDARARLQQFFACRDDSYGFFTSALT